MFKKTKKCTCRIDMSIASTYDVFMLIKQDFLNMSFNPEHPFNQLPPLPPALEKIKTRAILKACIPARVALAELQATGQQLPDQRWLVNILPMLEAKDSSHIENIVTTSDQLFQYADQTDRADPATKEALRYRMAMYEGVELLNTRPLCVTVAIQVCTRLRGVESDVRKTPGTVLGDQNMNIIYTPPEGEDKIRSLLSNWECFINEQDEIDPLIKMAIAHYQFESIHPFPDGNGRTGRILNILYLIHSKLLSLPVLYLSRFILENKNDYYTLLRAVTERGEWENWILYMLKAVTVTARWTTEKVGAITALINSARDEIQKSLPKIYTWELVNILFMQPYCRIENLVNAGIAQRQTASIYLKQLVKIGMLEEISVGRGKRYINRRLLKELRDN